MKTIHTELVERIRGELTDVASVVSRAHKAWLHVQRAKNEQDVYLDSVALNLHSFYSGLERIFELIAKHIDGSLPDTKTWHRDLLRSMAVDLEGLRPAVISQNNATSLDEFRRFRHLVRNVYTMNLAPEKMASLMSPLPKLWVSLQEELNAFADFLEESR